IQRPDNSPMEITEGDNAALFAQAISSRDCLLPGYVLFLSSEEQRTLGQGNLLNLNNLPPGTYHFVAKIGGLAGTDTAKQTVIVTPRNCTAPIMPDPGPPPPPAPPAPPPPRVMTLEDAQALF